MLRRTVRAAVVFALQSGGDCGIIFLHRGIAQLVEHRSPKPGVVGSNPAAPAK